MLNREYNLAIVFTGKLASAERICFRNTH